MPSGRRGSEFTPEVYKVAALERADALQQLYDQSDYTLAIYVAGVAVEALLRAYRAKINLEFSSRHDLYELAKEARFAERVPAAAFDKYAADLGALVARWSNSHRYRSAEAAQKYLKRGHLNRGLKGDPLKENARIAINAAMGLVTLGVRVWTR